MTMKYRLAVPANSRVHGSSPNKADILDTMPGIVTVFDKVKSYYKAIVAVIGAVLVVANQLTPVFDFLPGQDKGYITSGIAVLTAISTFLVANEHWVDDA